MRSSLLSVLALMAAAAVACLEHAGADPAAPRQSLTTTSESSGRLPTTGPGSDDWDWCWESLLTLSLCKHDLLAYFLAGRPAPRECCVAADEAIHHCGPLTRAFLGSILPRGPLAQCAHQQEATGGSPATRPSQRRAPPRAPTLETGPRASGGARPTPPPAPEARMDARSPPPRTPPEASVRVGEDEQSPPEPKVIVAGGRAGRTPDAPVAAGATTPPPQKGVRAARPSAKGP
ncbi:unnamed protein product [Urochloa decumbens]|uniref:Prolamin-like domain-containing protein n=1 Tax=Urochloa decumbens TaxID=240449 RepID=A0ABC9CTC1_9POAL